MHNGADIPELVSAYRQQLDRQIDRAAGQIEAERLQSPKSSSRDATPGDAQPSGFLATIADWFRSRRTQQLPGG